MNTIHCNKQVSVIIKNTYMEELYNDWQLTDSDVGNTEQYQFTKSELFDFARYYYDKKLNDERCCSK